MTGHGHVVHHVVLILLIAIVPFSILQWLNGWVSVREAH